MKFRHFVPALLISALTLNGCTAFLWGGNNPFHKTTTEKTVAKDKIHAFGVVAKDNTQLETGSLVMMGGKYWFVVNPKDSAKLRQSWMLNWTNSFKWFSKIQDMCISFAGRIEIP